MKKDTHPTYYKKADVKCACGNKIEVGSTKEKIRVEICSACHPFYTGKKQLVDTAGRAEKFEKRRKAAATAKKSAEKKDEDSKKDVGAKKTKKTETEELIEKAKEKLSGK